MNRTPFNALLKEAGGRFVDFAGWDMPVQFTGILAEHRAVREAAGLFDISHMGQVWVTGPDAFAYLQNLTTNDCRKLAPGKGLYTAMCREDGGVIDDLYIFQLEAERYLLIINAGRIPVDMPWMKDHLKGRVELMEQPQRAALALQGPRAADILKSLSSDAAALPRNGVGPFELRGLEVVVTRTGYTGEDGFEVFGPAGHLLALYPALRKAGDPHGLALCGLGARDTLRLEMGYRLNGQDMDERHSVLEAGLGWVVKFEKGPFVGSEALRREQERGSERRIVAFKLTEAGVARHGHALRHNGRAVGEVTSGTFSPSLGVGIGMGYVETRAYPKEAEGAPGLAAQVHGREIPVAIAALPFYRKDAVKTGAAV